VDSRLDGLATSDKCVEKLDCIHKLVQSEKVCNNGRNLSYPFEPNRMKTATIELNATQNTFGENAALPDAEVRG
jgi:hypothetical protein